MLATSTAYEIIGDCESYNLRNITHKVSKVNISLDCVSANEWTFTLRGHHARVATKADHCY